MTFIIKVLTFVLELFQLISIQFIVNMANDKQEVAPILGNQTSPLKVADWLYDHTIVVWGTE